MEPLPTEKVVKRAAAAVAKRKKGSKKPGAAFTVEENWPEMREEVRLLKDIHPYPKNPRTHPPAQLALLAELIKKHGPDQRIVVDEEGVILKGHGRHAAALIADLREFPVVVRLGLSESEKVAMRISDNAVALLSGWDQDLIRGEIVSLKSEGYDVGLLGFGEAQLVQFTTTPSPPNEFQQFGDDIDTKFCCPSCKYAWSGNPKAGEDPDEVAAAAKIKKTTKRK